MMKKILIIFIFMGNSEFINAQQKCENVYMDCINKLSMMLKEDFPSFKDAVFAVENAYFCNIVS